MFIIKCTNQSILDASLADFILKQQRLFACRNPRIISFIHFFVRCILFFRFGLFAWIQTICCVCVDDMVSHSCICVPCLCRLTVQVTCIDRQISYCIQRFECGHCNFFLPPNASKNEKERGKKVPNQKSDERQNFMHVIIKYTMQ